MMKKQIAQSMQSIRKMKWGTSLHLFVLAIFIFNTLVPSPALAQAPITHANGAGTDAEQTLPAQEPPAYYHAPQISLPGETTPTPTPDPDLPPQPLQQQIDFSISAEPGNVQLNQNFTLTVNLQNNSPHPETDIAFSDLLEAGLEYVPASDSPVSYNDQTREITYTVASIEPRATSSFVYQLTVTQKDENNKQGEIRIHSANLSLSNGDAESAQVPLESIATWLRTNHRSTHLIQVREETIGMTWGKSQSIWSRILSVQTQC
jgi:uncharacterized repeat protein (TIGR01451 family)